MKTGKNARRGKRLREEKRGRRSKKWREKRGGKIGGSGKAKKAIKSILQTKINEKKRTERVIRFCRGMRKQGKLVRAKKKNLE